MPGPVPLVVVGNIVVGGTGKTPTVIALVHALRKRGWNPGVVSRGYGSRPGFGAGRGPVQMNSDARAVGDEPLVIHRRTGAPVWIDQDRPAAVRALLQHHPHIDVVISDDGRQHRRLHRDADVLLFDERGVGNGLLLPAGPLREALPQVVGPDTVVVYNAEGPTTPLTGDSTLRRLGAVRPWTAWWRGDASPGLDISALTSRRWRAVAAIGHPERFFAMLEAAGVPIVRWPLPDHGALWPRPWTDDGLPVIMTEKDAVKIRPDDPDLSLLHVATLDFVLPESAVERILERLVAHRPSIVKSP